MAVNWQETLQALQSGQVRAAAQDAKGDWQANTEVKAAILAAFREGEIQPYEGQYQGFVDKDNLSPQSFSLEQNVRLVPGGSSVRHGAYIAPGVIIMPPAFVNTGAYVGTGTLIDSNVLVGSCAQIGAHVHLSAGVQIGGVLEPVSANPVVVEDDAFIGANAVIVEGIIVRRGAVLAPGVVLSRSVAIYDAVKEQVYAPGKAVPENAVVVPGARPVRNSWGQQQGLQVQCPVIVKYRDAQTDAALVLEEALR